MLNAIQNTLNNQDTNNDDVSKLMTPIELANYLGIGRNLAYQLLKDGDIKGFKIGNQWKVSKLAVDNYILKQSGIALVTFKN